MIILTVLALAIVVFVWRSRSYAPTPEQIVRLIERRLTEGTSKEWDYFRLVTIRNKDLEAIRERCLALDYATPEERRIGLTEILKKLHERWPTDRNT